MYRSWRQSIDHKKKGPGQSQTKAGGDGDLKNFYLKAAIDKDTIKTVSFTTILIQLLLLLAF